MPRHKHYVLFPLVCVLTALPALAGAGELRAIAGGFEYRCKLYRFQVAGDGAWQSLTIGDVECLGDRQAEGYLPRPALSIQADGTLAGSAGGRTLRFAFSNDRFRLHVHDAHQRGPEAHGYRLADHFRWALLPAKGGATYHLPHGHHLNHSDGARLISTTGVAIETGMRTAVGVGTHGFNTYIYPRGGELVVRPLAGYDPTNLLKLNFDNYPEDHLLPAGPIALPTRLANHSNEPLDLDVITTLETYVPNYPSEVLQTHRQSVQAGAGKTVDIAAAFEAVEPGPYEFKVTLLREGRKVKSVRGALIVDVENWTLPNLEPEGFDAFWQRTLTELRSRPLAPKITEPTDRTGVPAGFRYVSFNGLGGRRVRGLLAVPDRLEPGRKVPALLGLPGAGYGAAPPNAQAVREGMVMLALSIHDMPFGGESGRHHPREYWFDESYLGIGRRDPNTYYYRYGYAAAVRAVDYLRSLDCVDPNRIVVTGGSQGGSLTLAVAALADNIALARAGIAGRSRWDLLTWKYKANCSFEPPEGMSAEQMFHTTLAYFDVSYLARRIRCPIQMDIGLRDEINPGPLQLWAYRQIPESTPKRMVLDPWAKHGGIEGAAKAWAEMKARHLDRPADR